MYYVYKYYKTVNFTNEYFFNFLYKIFPQFEILREVATNFIKREHIQNKKYRSSISYSLLKVKSKSSNAISYRNFECRAFKFFLLILKFYQTVNSFGSSIPTESNLF